jgi:hypothetical protein
MPKKRSKKERETQDSDSDSPTGFVCAFSISGICFQCHNCTTQRLEQIWQVQLIHYHCTATVAARIYRERAAHSQTSTIYGLELLQFNHQTNHSVTISLNCDAHARAARMSVLSWAFTCNSDERARKDEHPPQAHSACFSSHTPSGLGNHGQSEVTLTS